MSPEQVLTDLGYNDPDPAQIAIARPGILLLVASFFTVLCLISLLVMNPTRRQVFPCDSVQLFAT